MYSGERLMCNRSVMREIWKQPLVSSNKFLRTGTEWRSDSYPTKRLEKDFVMG